MVAFLTRSSPLGMKFQSVGSAAMKYLLTFPAGGVLPKNFPPGSGSPAFTVGLAAGFLAHQGQAVAGFVKKQSSRKILMAARIVTLRIIIGGEDGRVNHRIGSWKVELCPRGAT